LALEEVVRFNWMCTSTLAAFMFAGSESLQKASDAGSTSSFTGVAVNKGTRIHQYKSKEAIW
jgi:hypothetical protein